MTDNGDGSAYRLRAYRVGWTDGAGVQPYNPIDPAEDYGRGWTDGREDFRRMLDRARVEYGFRPDDRVHVADGRGVSLERLPAEDPRPWILRQGPGVPVTVDLLARGRAEDERRTEELKRRVVEALGGTVRR